jgi:hypothetical protein
MMPSTVAGLRRQVSPGLDATEVMHSTCLYSRAEHDDERFDALPNATLQRLDLPSLNNLLATDARFVAQAAEDAVLVVKQL